MDEGIRVLISAEREVVDSANDHADGWQEGRAFTNIELAAFKAQIRREALEEVVQQWGQGWSQGFGKWLNREIGKEG